MEECIFCNIINGKFSSATIYENEEFKVILDRFPATMGHVLILSKDHVTNIFELEPEKGGRLFQLAVQIAGVMKKTLGFTDMNVMQNNGVIAGQTVNHFHLHLIPRYEDDGLKIAYTPLEISDANIEEIRKKIFTGV